MDRRVFLVLLLAGCADPSTNLVPVVTPTPPPPTPQAPAPVVPPTQSGVRSFDDWSRDFYSRAVKAGLPASLLDRELAGLVPDPLSDRLRPQLEAVLFIDRNPCRHSPQEAYEIGITGVAWIGEYHLLAPLQENGEDKHHRRRGA